MPSDHQVQERNSIKVRTVLRQFVRDWADEGAPERDLQYGCLLDALGRYVPNAFKESGGQAKKSRVLTPGSGLSRLPFECARRGYAAQGNEFSYHMLQGCKWVPWPLLYPISLATIKRIKCLCKCFCFVVGLRWATETHPDLASAVELLKKHTFLNSFWCFCLGEVLNETAAERTHTSLGDAFVEVVSWPLEMDRTYRNVRIQDMLLLLYWSICLF